MKDILNVIPAQEGVRAIKQDVGKPFDLGPFISGGKYGEQRPHLHHVRIEFGPWRRPGSAQASVP